MRLFSLPPFFIGCLLFFGAITPQSPARQAFEEDFESQRTFRLLGGPSREGPEAQWQRVQDFAERGRRRTAIRHARYLVETWPDHPRAPESLRLISDMQTERGNYALAFDALQRLIDGYAGMFDYNEVLALQLNLAERLEQRTVRALFGTFNDPSEAIPLFRQLVTNAPHAPETPDWIYRIGKIHLQRRNFEEAIQEFDLLEQRYPTHPLAEQAAIRRAETFARLARRHPTDAAAQQSAWQAFMFVLEAYPATEARETVEQEATTFLNRLAGMRYEQARFYQENMRRPDAALVAFRSLVQQFPESEWAGPAQKRVQALQPAPEHP